MLTTVAVAALVLSLSACSGTDVAPTPVPSSDAVPPSGAGTTAPPAPITLMQHIGDDTTSVRRLGVDPAGTWFCKNCAGDGKESEGQLSSAQHDDLRRLVASPEFREEVQQRRGRRYSCDGALYSTLLTDQGAITVTDCPQEEHPPTTDAILRLLADATPVEIAKSVSA
jgi:hypothetical protein